MESAMFALAMFGVGLGFVGVLFYVREIILLVRAERDLVRVLAERDEYRPLLRRLLLRQRAQGGTLSVTEHEVIDLREEVADALVHLSPARRRRAEEGLFQDSSRGRQFYLLSVLTASIQRLQRQPA
jgi:hypothetical protein